VTEEQNCGDEGVSDVSTISVMLLSRKKLAGQLLSGFYEACKSSKDQSTGLR